MHLLMSYYSLSEWISENSAELNTEKYTGLKQEKNCTYKHLFIHILLSNTGHL